MELTMQQKLTKSDDCTKQQPPVTLKWDKLTDSDKSRYTQRLLNISATHMSPIHVFNCHLTCVCDSSSCQQLLQAEYDHLIHCLKDADKCLPCFKPGTEKDWWTEDLAKCRPTPPRANTHGTTRCTCCLQACHPNCAAHSKTKGMGSTAF